MVIICLDILYEYSLNGIFRQYAIASYDVMGMKSFNGDNNAPSPMDVTVTVVQLNGLTGE